MLSRYWREQRELFRWVGAALVLLFAGIGLYLLGISVGKGVGHYDAEANGYSAEYPHDTDQRVEACFNHVDVTRAKECAQEAIEASRESQRSEQDLSAQRQMSKWALWLLIFTAGQSLLGVAGFIALIVTIRQGREANKISREDQRPLISFDVTFRDQLMIATGPTDTLGPAQIHAFLDITIKNIGKKPANFICHNCYLFVPDGDGDEPLRAADFGKEPPEKRGFLLFPGDEVNRADRAWCPISEFDQSPLFAKRGMAQIALVVVVWYGEDEGSPWLSSRQVFQMWNNKGADAFNMLFEKRTSAYHPRNLRLEVCSGGMTT